MISKLLIRPKPFMNESLASYINRLCNENVCKINWILEPIKVNMNKIYNILNGISNDEMIFKIIEATGLSESEINNMTCNKFIINSSYNNMFLSLWRDEVKCCPLCLQEKYYHQIHWQLVYVKVCLKHNVVLSGVCLCGKKIEMNELIEGVCECGMEFSKLKPSQNIDEDIYINQYRIYEALEIEQKLRKMPIRESIFCGFNKEKFLFLYYLILTSMAQMDNAKLLKLSEMYCLQLNKVNKVKSVLIIEKIVNNYPDNFYILLDLLNDFWTAAYTRAHRKYLLRISTPISTLGFHMDDKLHELFHKEFHWYLITRYNQYNKKLIFLYRYARENEYINIDVVEHGYLFPRNIIDSLFNIKVVDGTKCIEINEVLNFISEFIGRSTVFFDEDRENFIPLRQLLDFFSALKIRLDIITSIILEEKIEIKIYIYNCGLEMINIHKDSAIKSIIRFILEAYRKDKTL